ncbi:MAG: protein-arginine deiminase family protein [Thermoplasmatota archaeon]
MAPRNATLPLTALLLLVPLTGVTVTGADAPFPSGAIDLDVDADRDGLIHPDRDETGEASASVAAGALYQVNLDDDDADGLPDGLLLAEDGTPAALDGRVNGERDLADLAPVHLRASAADLLALRLSAELDDLRAVQLFAWPEAGTPAAWGGPQETRTTLDILPLLQEGRLELGLEGLFFAWDQPGAHGLFPDGFDGVVRFTATALHADGAVSTDTVALRVAPLLVTPATQEAKVVFERRGLLLGTDALTDGNDWVRDHATFGSTGAPGLDPMDVVLRLPYARPELPQWPTDLLGPDVGWYLLADELGGAGGDHGGNLLALPPTDGAPLGRILVGSTMSDALYGFFVDQGAQAPFPKETVDTSWLAVGHLDERVNVLPDPDAPDGWRLVVARPATAAELEVQTDAATETAPFLESIVRPFLEGTLPVGDDCVRYEVQRRAAPPNPSPPTHDDAGDGGPDACGARASGVRWMTPLEEVPGRWAMDVGHRAGIEGRLLDADAASLGTRLFDGKRLMVDGREGRFLVETEGRADVGAREGRASDGARFDHRFAVGGRATDTEDPAFLGSSRFGVRALDNHVSCDLAEAQGRRAIPCQRATPGIATPALDDLRRSVGQRAAGLLYDLGLGGGDVTTAQYAGGPLDGLAERLGALTGADVVEVPVHWEESPRGAVAALPSAVNFVHVDGVTHVPTLEAGSALDDEARGAFGETVRFVPNDRLHAAGGELHCATNVWRIGLAS